MSNLSVEQARAWYPEGDAVHGFAHVERVLHLALKLAELEGADCQIVQAAALLHDSQGGSGSHARPDHHETSAAFARRVLAQEGWPAERIEAVAHCIRAHRFRSPAEAPATLEAQVLYDADKLDAIGAIGAARAIAYSVQEGKPLYSRPSQKFLDSGVKEEGEEHSAYHEYLFKLRRIRERLFTASARRVAQQRHALMSAYFEQLQREIEGLEFEAPPAG